MRALVTGAAGFIGSHLSERLLASGFEVTGVDCFTDYYPPERKRRNLAGLLASDGFRFVEGDIAGIALERLLAAGDIVFHLAAQPGVRQSWGREFEIYTTQNVLATQRLLEACKGVGIGRLVYASSSSIYGDADHFPTRESATPAPVSPYGVTKLAAEHLCLLYQAKFEVPSVALRYFTVFGPRQRPDMAFTRFIEAALDGRSIEVFGDGLQVRDFTYVSDAVAATMAAGMQGTVGGVYNVAGGTSASVLDVVEVLGSLLGGPVEVEHLPSIPGDARRTGADVARARAELGYEPQFTLEAGLAAQLHAQQEARAAIGSEAGGAG